MLVAILTLTFALAGLALKVVSIVRDIRQNNEEIDS